MKGVDTGNRWVLILVKLKRVVKLETKGVKVGNEGYEVDGEARMKCLGVMDDVEVDEAGLEDNEVDDI
ncbi:unnamed protein product [Sphenostylis stenocarpa]|uniref:Uncharacterized protein n=1 Tax=Sphenostylis stenocarpa TaxID=92480 RepID=A0AA86S223_9FABA|nr:unnamed protein product [Sphenostylis stenocarpa]